MKSMKFRLTVAPIVAGMLLAWSGAALADEQKTITGEGQCAKCALKETDECQNAIVTVEHGKKVTYYLTQNEVSKEFHGKICKKTAKVQATGTVKELHGKLELTPTKIELVKE